MSDRITYRRTPHGWFGVLEPDWRRYAEAAADRPEPTPEERLAASIRYVQAVWGRKRGAGPYVPCTCGAGSVLPGPWHLSTCAITQASDRSPS